MVLVLKKILIFGLIILFLASCKLFESKDTTAPIVNLTIDGGNEISREVTLYLDIEDDSKIDYVDIMIDDTSAVTITTNFDTIRLDVTPFADESEHHLFAKVADSEGNIGESEKLDVVITEFPGWLKYNDIEMEYSPTTLLADDNGRIWLGFWDGCKVYDPLSNNVREISFPDTIYHPYVEDFAIVEGSRVWIATDFYISEYHYDLDKWIQIVEPPYDSTSAVDGNNNPIIKPQLIWTIALDRNYNLYIGANSDHLLKYNGAHFKKFWLPGDDVFSMELHPNGTIYYFNEWGQQSYIYNDIVYPYENFPYEGGMKRAMIIDSEGNVWLEPPGRQFGGYYIYDGTNWTNMRSSHPAENVYPLLCTKSGLVYTETVENDNNHGVATYDGETWLYFSELDSPFNTDEIPSVLSLKPIIDEAPNGDIWMVLDNILWRYRPSLGGYP